MCLVCGWEQGCCRAGSRADRLQVWVNHLCGCWPPAQPISRLTPLAPAAFHCSSSLKPYRLGAACQGLLPCRHTVPLPQPCRRALGCPCPPRAAAHAGAPSPSYLAIEAAGVSHRHRPGTEEAANPEQTGRSHLAPGKRQAEKQVSREAGKPEEPAEPAEVWPWPHGPGPAPSPGPGPLRAEPQPPAGRTAPPPPSTWQPRRLPSGLAASRRSARVKGGSCGYTLTAPPRPATSRPLPPGAGEQGTSGTCLQHPGGRPSGSRAPGGAGGQVNSSEP